MYFKFAVCCILFATAVYAQEKIVANSLIPPHEKYDSQGNRFIDNWMVGGDSMIKEYFVRLTPDRQSKMGYAWNKSPLNEDEWVVNLKFRISGQGQSLFGDGFAFFYTQNSYHQDGKMFGTTDTFKGFSVVFDTFKNTEFAQFHRDIGLYVNRDGKQGVFNEDKPHPGCFSQYRYCEKRQDFSADNAAVARIAYNAKTGTLRVLIDEHNTGSFKECINEHIEMELGWNKNAYIGLSSTTGQLADNHDILSLVTYGKISDPSLIADEKKVQEKQIAEEESNQLSKLLREEGIDFNNLNVNEKAILNVVRKIDQKQQAEVAKLKRELERQLTAVDDNLNSLINKLAKREDVSEGRINDLENRINERMNTKLSTELDSRILKLESYFQEHLNEEVKAKSGKWILPFCLLSIVLIGFFVIAYRKYNYLTKTHLL
ncbi:hypothetical protein WA158_002050 [Blastocystis sp. Blastoise]